MSVFFLQDEVNVVIKAISRWISFE